MKTSSTSFKSKYCPSSLNLWLSLDSFVSSHGFAPCNFFSNGSQYGKSSVLFSVFSHYSVFLGSWGCSSNCYSSIFCQTIEYYSVSYVTWSQFLYLLFLEPARPKTVTVSHGFCPCCYLVVWFCFGNTICKFWLLRQTGTLSFWLVGLTVTLSFVLSFGVSIERNSSKSSILRSGAVVLASLKSVLLSVVSTEHLMSFGWGKFAESTGFISINSCNGTNSLTIRQKCEAQNGCFKETKHAKFSEKTNIFYPLMRTMCAYQGVRNVRFSENLGCFVFLQHPIVSSRVSASP